MTSEAIQSTTSEKETDERPVLYLFTPEKDYVRPYFERLMPDYAISDRCDNAIAAVMISTTDIYDANSGSNINELHPIKQDSREAYNERYFTETCERHGLAATILRCAPIVCTGMQGTVYCMAKKIYAGSYVGVSENEAVVSVVHAVDLPAAYRAVAGHNDIYNVSDGKETRVNELADSLAWRMSQKRIFTIKEKWYRLLFGKKKLADAYRSLTFSCEKIKSSGAFNPNPVTEYLKTHVYDEQSL